MGNASAGENFSYGHSIVASVMGARWDILRTWLKGPSELRAVVPRE